MVFGGGKWVGGWVGGGRFSVVVVGWMVVVCGGLELVRDGSDWWWWVVVGGSEWCLMGGGWWLRWVVLACGGG